MPTDAAATAVLPAIPSGDELYALLMGRIEADLLPDALPALEEKYRGESPADAKARAERYRVAFAEYDRQYAAYVAELEQRVRSYERTSMASVEREDQADEHERMQTIESAISSL